jgi:hypothetical protein
MKKHGNKAYDKMRVANDELYRPVRLQLWFWDGKEQYWVVDESQQAAQESQAHRPRIHDVGEESNDSEANASSGSNSDSDSNSEDSQDDTNSDSLDDIDEDIEGWKAEPENDYWRH